MRARCSLPSDLVFKRNTGNGLGGTGKSSSPFFRSKIGSQQSETSLLQMFSGTLLDNPLQRSAVATAAREFSPVFQHHHIFAVVDWNQFLNLADIYDRRTVNADKVVRIQPLGHAADRFAEEIRFLADVQAYIVGRGLDPLDAV